jgi:hypothetical protein
VLFEESPFPDGIFGQIRYLTEDNRLTPQETLCHPWHITNADQSWGSGHASLADEIFSSKCPRSIAILVPINSIRFSQ